MKKTALILVDLQNDFMPGGALAVAEGDATVAIANRIMPNYDVVVATQDWHPADHGSFAANHDGKKPGEFIELDGLEQILWPVHCVQGTPGASFHSSLKVERIDAVVRKGRNPRVDSYSGFFDNGGEHSTGMTDLLRAYNVEAVEVMGLATDFCVKFTVLDAVRQGFEVKLLPQGCRGVGLREGDIEKALADMKKAGAVVE